MRRVQTQADEELLRALRDDLENRFAGAGDLFPSNGQETDKAPDAGNGQAAWLRLLGKWDDTLSNPRQFASQKGVYAEDLNAETERLYADHVAPARAATRVGAPGSRGVIRSYCTQVLKQARLWERMQKGVRAEEFTFPGDPMRLDYGYRRNGTRGFLQALSVTRAHRCQAPRLYRGPHPRQSADQ